MRSLELHRAAASRWCRQGGGEVGRAVCGAAARSGEAEARAGRYFGAGDGGCLLPAPPQACERHARPPRARHQRAKHARPCTRQAARIIHTACRSGRREASWPGDHDPACHRPPERNAAGSRSQTQSRTAHDIIVHGTHSVRYTHTRTRATQRFNQRQKSRTPGRHRWVPGAPPRPTRKAVFSQRSPLEARPLPPSRGASRGGPSPSTWSSDGRARRRPLAKKRKKWCPPCAWRRKAKAAQLPSSCEILRVRR